MKRFSRWSLTISAVALLTCSPPALAEQDPAQVEAQTDAAVAAAQAVVAADVAADQAPAYDREAVSYAIGVNLAASWAQQLAADDVDYSVTALADGFRDKLADGEMRFTEAQITEAMDALRAQLTAAAAQRQQAAQAAAATAAAENLAAGKLFLAKNAQVEGVVTTDTGLQYQIIAPGEGDHPTLGDEVTVNYTGTLLDGTVFDSSVNPIQPGRPAEPVTFRLGQVIEGWNEGLGLIGPGGKIKLFIPADLAYGDQAAGPTIGPGSTLIFDVELIAVTPGSDPRADEASSVPTE